MQCVADTPNFLGSHMYVLCMYIYVLLLLFGQLKGKSKTKPPLLSLTMGVAFSIRMNSNTLVTLIRDVQIFFIGLLLYFKHVHSFIKTLTILGKFHYLTITSFSKQLIEAFIIIL